VDIDEVICPMIRPLARKHGKPVASPARYRFSEILGVSEKDSAQMVMDWYHSDEFMDVEPFPGVVESLQAAADSGNKVFLVSSRQWYGRERTEEWLRKYELEPLISELVLCNSFSLHGQEIPKVAAIQSIGADACIDDSPSVIADCLQAGIPAMMCLQEGLNSWSTGNDFPVCRDLEEGISNLIKPAPWLWTIPGMTPR
jgi:hypothetical protein